MLVKFVPPMHAVLHGISQSVAMTQQILHITQRTGLAGAMTGARALKLGFGFLWRHPVLWKYALMSVSVAGVIVVLLWLAAWNLHSRLYAGWPAPEEGAWLVGYRVVRWMVWLAMTAVALAMAPILSSLTAAPFHDRLSEKVEERLLGQSNGVFEWSTFIRDVLTGVLHSLLNLSIYLPLAALCVVVQIVPVIGTVAGTGGGLLLTATMLSLEFMDFPQSRRRWSWRRKVRLVGQQPALMLGFGAAAALLLSIPFMTLLTAPVAVVGGTILLVSMERHGLCTGRTGVAQPVESV